MELRLQAFHLICSFLGEKTLAQISIALPLWTALYIYMHTVDVLVPEQAGDKTGITRRSGRHYNLNNEN